MRWESRNRWRSQPEGGLDLKATRFAMRPGICCFVGIHVPATFMIQPIRSAVLSLLLAVAFAVPASGQLVINEFLASNDNGLLDDEETVGLDRTSKHWKRGGESAGMDFD